MKPARSLGSAKTLAWQQGERARAKLFCALLHRHGLPLPQLEYRWHPERRYRADFAWPQEQVLLEAQGGYWKGRRRHGSPYDDDRRNQAQLLGWQIYAVPSSELLSEDTIALVREALLP